MSTIITIVGKSGGGKTTVAVNLATLLARNNNSLVALLSTDLSYSSIPQFFGVKIPIEKSVSAMMQSETPERMMQETIEGSNIFVTGITDYETCQTAEPPNGEQIQLMFARLKNAFDYVIIEANAPLLNYMSAVAISSADILLTVIPATVQGERWQHAYREMIDVYADPKAPRINVLNKAEACVETKAFLLELKETVQCVLPYHIAIMQAESAGKPICDSENVKNSRPVREFCKVMEQMALAIVDGLDDEPELEPAEEGSDAE